MIRVEESVEINRPVEEVFSYTSTPKNFPQWAATVIEVRHEDAPGGDYPLGREPVSSDGTRFTARIEAEPGGGARSGCQTRRLGVVCPLWVRRWGSTIMNTAVRGCLRRG
jgi:hypothetical protein